MESPRRRLIGESKKAASHDTLPPIRHERVSSLVDSGSPRRSKSRGDGSKVLSREESIDKPGGDKLKSHPGSKHGNASKRNVSTSALLPTIMDESNRSRSPPRSPGRTSANESTSATSPRLTALSFSNLPTLSNLNRTPSPRVSPLHHGPDSPRLPLSPAKKAFRGQLKSSWDSRPGSLDGLSLKGSTIGSLDDINIADASLSASHGLLRRTYSEPFFASWDYGNLEANFLLPSGTHISQHYDALQTRRSKRHRKRVLRKEESKRVPARDFHLISDLHAKLTIGEREENDVIYEDERRNERELVVVAGTASKLFSLLADHRVQDKEYIDVYLATHLRFISTRQLFDQLLDRFRNPLAMLTFSSSAPLTHEETQEYIPLIQMRIVNVFKKWLRYHYAYEFDDQFIASQMEAFMNELSRSDNNEHVQWAAFLRASWSQRHTTNFDAFESDASDSPKLLIPSITVAADLSFLDIHPTELARQLTIVHQNMFHRVRNFHLLQFLKDKDDPGNPVGEIAAFSAKLTNWVCYELASTATVKKRVQVFANFVKLSVALKNISNFQGALDIFLGLNHYLVSRLRKTIKSVDSSTKDKLKQLGELFDTAGGLKNLRKHIKATASPLIIPASIWLHDLVLINENDEYWSNDDDSLVSSSPDTLSASTSTSASSTSSTSSPNLSPIIGSSRMNLKASSASLSVREPLINFSKLRLLSNTFAEVYRCQLEPFGFSSLPVLQEYIANHLDTVSSQELEAMINNVVTSQEARKDSSIASAGSSSSAPSASTSPSTPRAATAAPPKSPKSTLSRKSSLSSLFRLKINSPSAKKEPKDI